MDGSGFLHLTIPRKRAAGDIDYVVEQATVLNDPLGWNTVETVPVSETDTEIIVRTAQALDTLSPQFLRLRIRFIEPSP